MGTSVSNDSAMIYLFSVRVAYKFYTVTREEPAWESFSEDEPAPKKLKGPPAATFNGGTKAARKGGRPGQGNIMSFFAKK